METLIQISDRELAQKLFGANQFWDYWQLKVKRGRQTWHFDGPEQFLSKSLSANDLSETDQRFLKDLTFAFRFDKSSNPNSADQILRNQLQNRFPALESDRNLSSLQKAKKYFAQLQTEDGHWAGDYGGPMFLLPGLLVVSYITGQRFPLVHSEMMKTYMLNHQNYDGGWGLHIEGGSTLFGTVMQYVALRILGCSAEMPELIFARKWIEKNGGATGVPPWGKFYLAVLGVYDWKGCNSLFPEMWLVPNNFPIHPANFWCHCRMVYLPMAYCYGNRITGKLTPLVKELRKELYTEPYARIDWKAARDKIAPTDLYEKPSGTFHLLNKVLNPYEKIAPEFLREDALEFILDYVKAEDDQTDGIDIGPVNQVINSLCIWHAYGPDSARFKKHAERWNDYLWVAEDGMKMNGYNGSQLWDTAFAVQAFLEAPDLEHDETLADALEFISDTQVREEVEEAEKFFRHPSKGGWPFSTLDHGWPIADCTAEGLCASLKLQNHLGLGLGGKRLQEAVDLILGFQNKDGGWATYELQRGGSWYEKLNPSGIFAEIMVDYSWVECTAACVKALIEFGKVYPTYESRKIKRSVDRGVEFILKKQRKDGSWVGSWGVCFTYGGCFALEALGLYTQTYGGTNKIEAALKKGSTFLMTKQRSDGGWGESQRSCVEGRYVEHDSSQVINTSWALLGLMAAGRCEKSVIERGINFLESKQKANGDWPQQGISGVFNKSCMITYANYRNIFPIWALSRFQKLYENREHE